MFSRNGRVAHFASITYSDLKLTFATCAISKPVSCMKSIRGSVSLLPSGCSLPPPGCNVPIRAHDVPDEQPANRA